MRLETMDDLLLESEKSFFTLNRISDRDWLETALHIDFSELGKSGKHFGRKETMDALLSCTQDRDIQIYNFSTERLCQGCYMAHYITVDEDGKCFYRTSIWIGEETPQLRYHQASPVVRPDILRLY